MPVRTRPAARPGSRDTERSNQVPRSGTLRPRTLTFASRTGLNSRILFFQKLSLTFRTSSPDRKEGRRSPDTSSPPTRMEAAFSRGRTTRFAPNDFSSRLILSPTSRAMSARAAAAAVPRATAHRTIALRRRCRKSESRRIRMNMRPPGPQRVGGVAAVFSTDRNKATCFASSFTATIRSVPSSR